jgi:parallel beta-helix repeat protein
VTTATELQNALTTAAFNGEDDNIQIVQGTYESNFVYAASEKFNLTIEGGYTTGCASRVVDPSNTVLNGGGNASVLILVDKNAIEFMVDGLTIENGLTTGNPSGGGLHISTDDGDVTLSHNIISGNTANSSGGGAYIEGSSTISISDNTISGNTAKIYHGGGIYFSSSSTATFTDNTISDNTANHDGGGIYFSSGTATFTDNTISGNTANSRNGGGIYFSEGTATFTDNTISDNTADEHGGGIYVYDGETTTLINNVISGNITNSDDGGGVFIYGDTTTLTNNTITSNTAGDNGGGIWLELYDDSDAAHIYNNIIWNNSASSQGGDLYINNDGNNNFIASTVSLFNNDFDQTLASGIHIVLPFPIDSSNLNNLDPLFVDADNDDYHLQAGSPCTEAGDNDAPELPATDKDGNPRIGNSVVDLGAYEYQSSPPSQVQFSASSYEVNEGDGTATITVTRTASSEGAVSVEYATSDDTAREDEDYLETSGQLDWADGDKSKRTFTVDIIDDGDEEGDEQLTVSLGNPVGAILGTPDTATLSILDDDGTTEYSTLKIKALTGGGKLILKAKGKKGL